MLIELNENNFNSEIQTGVKVVEFYAPWCGYCKKQEDVLKEMDKIWIGQVNTDNNSQIAIRYGINSFPTFLIFKNGKEIERFSGLKSKYDLMDKILNYMK